jgi:hypothetical protein
MASKPWWRVMTDLAAHVARQAKLVPLAKELGRAVARGLLPLETACSYLEYQHLDCPVGMRTPTDWALRDTVRETELGIARAKGIVRYKVKPLCEDRKPGREILAMAREARGPLRDWELLDLCVEVQREVYRRELRHG